MKRPLCVIGFPFALATWAAFQAPVRVVLLFSAGILLTAVFLWILPRAGRPVAVCTALLSACVAFAGCALYRHNALEPFEKMAGQTAEVQGLVLAVSEYASYTDMTIRARASDELPAATLSIRSWGEAQAKPGDIVECSFRPDGVADARYLARGVSARGTLDTMSSRQRDGAYYLDRSLMLLREVFRRNLYDKLPQESADILGTMVMRIGDDIPSDVYRAMNRSGTSHLLSISGLHFSVLCAFLLALFGKLPLPRRIPELLTLVASLLFALLAGFSASIARAFTMTAIMLMGRVLSRRADALNSLGLAMLVICIARPLWTQGLGMWLSAASTLGILTVASRLSGWMTARLFPGAKPGGISLRFVRAASVGIGAYAFSLPIIALGTGWFSLVSPLANVLITPFVAPVIIGGMLCAALPWNPLPVRLLAGFTDLCLRAVTAISEAMANLPFATATLDHFWMILWAVFAACILAVAAFFHRERKTMPLGIMLCVLTLSVGGISDAAASRGRLELVTLAGCDSAVLIRDREAVILGTPSKYEIQNLLRYLEYRGIQKIPAVVAYDSGETVGSGLRLLSEFRKIDAVIGPDDGYIVDQIALALKGTPVYCGGYATIDVLGGVKIVPVTGTDDNILSISFGGWSVRKVSRAYEGQSPDHIIHLYREGDMLLPDRVRPVYEPLGARLFGEARLLLKEKYGGVRLAL